MKFYSICYQSWRVDKGPHRASPYESYCQYVRRVQKA